MSDKDEPTSQQCPSTQAQEPLTVLRPDGTHDDHHDHPHHTDECESSCLQCPNLHAEDLMDLTMREVFGI